MANVVKFSGRRGGALATVNRKVGQSGNSGRPRNAELRTREYLTPDEVERLIKAAGKLGRHSHRDATLLLVIYRHGLRVSELVGLKREQVDLKNKLLHVTRRKNGIPTTHPLSGRELRALRKVIRDYEDNRYVFVTERGDPLTPDTVRKLVQRAGQAARLKLSVHTHMLRHSTGYYLANEGIDTRTIQHYLGHRQIQHTVRYTELAPNRFKGLWED